MKNIRATVVAALIGVSTFTGMAQPVYAQKIFTDQKTEHIPAQIIDPDLKKVLPLVFAQTDQESTPITEESTMFATPFVDNSSLVANKAVSNEKVMPIATDDMLGISTFFTRFHPGIDFRAPVGTTIHAAVAGIVNEVSYEKGGYGKYVVLVHHIDGKTYFSLYAHMKETKVTLGESVSSGTQIGMVGLTGHTTGAHLHFEVHTNDHAMDPLKFLAGNTIAKK